MVSTLWCLSLFIFFLGTRVVLQVIYLEAVLRIEFSLFEKFASN